MERVCASAHRVYAACLSLDYLRGFQIRRRCSTSRAGAFAWSTQIPANHCASCRPGLGRFAWVPELNAMGFGIAGELFIGAGAHVGDRRIEVAFDRFAAGILSVPLRLPFTPFTRALQAREFLLAFIDRAID